MSIITIQCRLIAHESTRRQVWELMAQKNTPLINELLNKIPQQLDFEAWCKKGKIPAGTIKNICDTLKSDPKFSDQPCRFYTSALSQVDYIYRSYLKIQQKLQRQLEGLKRWLEMLKSDEELVEETALSLEDIRSQATKILSSLPSSTNISQSLFDTYAQTKNIFNKSAICYLLKNGCKLPQKAEDPKKFCVRRRKVEIKIERLTEQIESRLPQGRDLTGQSWLEILDIAANTVPQNAQQTKRWQDKLLTRTKSIPFPISFETNEDLIFSKNQKGRLCVRFNGLAKYTFQIYCDQRQLKWFQRFYEDQQIKKENKNKHSSALFTLRSGELIWREEKGKGDPWNIHHLYLHCSLDTRLWTMEGTEQVRQGKATDVAEILTKMKEKSDLSDQQLAFIRRKESTLARLENPFPRPSQHLYLGQPQIIVGVAMTLEKPATVAVVDATTGKAITYRSIRQLLGDNYKLLNRQRQQKQDQSHQRHKAQKNFEPNRLGDSKLGEYLDRLIASSIVDLAKTYQAGSIVVPELSKMREIIQAEIQAKAEAKIPGCIEAQQKYAKQYRINIHQWSYGRLIDNIRAQASLLGIIIETGKQGIRGSPQEQARDLAIAAYQSRMAVKS